MSCTNCEHPVHTWKSIPQNLARDFKIHCLQQINDLTLTQTDVAEPIGVNNSTVSRWFDVSGDLNFPACFIPALNTSKTIPLATSMLTFGAERLGMVLTRKIPVRGMLDGSLDDETLDMVKHLGKLVEDARRDCKGKIRLCKRDVMKIHEATLRALEEIRQMEEK
jgi:hypothetical protein